jgi:hypothetical protein
MKIIEQTEARLAFKIGIPLINWTQCDLDRTTGRARIRRVTFFWPRKTVDIPLGEIQAVSLMGGAGAENSVYEYPMLTLNSGECIKLAVHQYSQSRKAVDAVGAFLQQGSPTSAPRA